MSRTDELERLLARREPDVEPDVVSDVEPDLEDAEAFTARTLDRLPPPTRPDRWLVLGTAFGLALLALAFAFPALLARIESLLR